jgi:hypothetical protein
MNDAPQDKSGNRWDPANQPADTSTTEAPEPPAVPSNPPAPPEAETGAPQRRLRDRVGRARAGLAGAAALLLRGGGVGGFLVGQTTGSAGPDHGRNVRGLARPEFGEGGPRGLHDGAGRGHLQPPPAPGNDHGTQPDDTTPGNPDDQDD